MPSGVNNTLNERSDDGLKFLSFCSVPLWFWWLTSGPLPKQYPAIADITHVCGKSCKVFQRLIWLSSLFNGHLFKFTYPWKWPLTKSLIFSFDLAWRFWNSCIAWNLTTLRPLGRIRSSRKKRKEKLTVVLYYWQVVWTNVIIHKNCHS